jgi:hypothetical protein
VSVALKGELGLSVRVRLPGGRLFEGEIAAARHRRVQLGALHGQSIGLVEIAAGPRRADGTLDLSRTRRRADYYLPGGGGGGGQWLQALCALVERHASRDREEVFVGPAERRGPGGRAGVIGSWWLWLDIDDAERLAGLRAFLRRTPAQLVVSSGGSGGAHAYWRLDRAHDVDEVEAANERLAAHLGGDRRCKNADRVMRLAGTVNQKSGRHARILWADLAARGCSSERVLSGVAELERREPRRECGVPRFSGDPHRAIHPVEYFHRLAGVEVPRSGLISCPHPAHPDRHPSTSVSAAGWYCHSHPGGECGGGIYDLASALLGGPTGAELRGESFRRAAALVREAFAGIRSEGGSG